MPDVAEVGGPPAVDQSGNFTLWWVPTIANKAAPTALEIGAGTAFRITYSLTPDGYNLGGTQAKNKDERLAMLQSFESLGVSEATLSLKYVDSTTAGSAAVVLVEGLSGNLVERRGVPNSTTIAAAQKVRVIPVTLGKQIPGPVDGTGKFTYTQEVAITGVVGAAVAVV